MPDIIPLNQVIDDVAASNSSIAAAMGHATPLPDFVDATGQGWDKNGNPIGNSAPTQANVSLNSPGISSAPSQSNTITPTFPKDIIPLNQVQDDIPRSWGDTLSDTGKSIAKSVSGVAGVGGTLADIISGNVITSPIEQALTGQHAPTFAEQAAQIDQARQNIIGDPEYRKAGLAERTISQGIGALPYAALGGGIPAAIASGGGGELAKSMGLPEWAGQLVGGVGGGLATDTAQSIAKSLPGAADSLEIRAAGARPSDFNISNRREGIDKFLYDANGVKTLNTNPETSIKQSLREVINDGVLKGSPDPSQVWQKAVAKHADLNSKVDKLITTADQNLGATKVYPKFTTTESMINSAPVADRSALRQKLAEQKSLIRSEGNGTVSFLQNQKKKLGAVTYQAGEESAKDFNVALTRDYRRTIEDVVGNVVPDAKGKIRSLNSKIGSYEEAIPIIQKGIPRAEGENATDKAINLMKTTGGYGVPILTGAIVGSHVGPIGAIGGIVGAGAGVATGKVISKLRSPEGMQLSANVLKALDIAASKAPKSGMQSIVGSPAQALVSALNNHKSQLGTVQTQLPTRQVLPQLKYSSQSPGAKVNDKEAADVLKDVPTPLPKSAPQVASSQMKTDVSSFIKQQPKLIQAVIQTESSGNHLAESGTGAQGLMQLTHWAQRRFDVKDPFDPKQNVEAGTKLLHAEFEKWDDPMISIAAYQAGDPVIEEAVNIAKSKGLTVNWTNIKPYLPEETQKYPLTVAKHYSNLTEV